MRLRSKTAVMAGVILAGVLAGPSQTVSAMEVKALSVSAATAGVSTKKGWVKDGGKWYFYDSKGVKKTGWYQAKEGWYYLNPSSGAMVTGWKQISKKWYYFASNGIMARSEFRGGYWLNANGTCTDKNIYSWKQSDKKWWFGNSSWYAKNHWYKIDGKYYYFYPNGYLARKMWIGNDYVDASGAWVSGKQSAGTKTSVKVSGLAKYSQLKRLLGEYDLFVTKHDYKNGTPGWFSIATDTRYSKDFPVKAKTVQGADPLGSLYSGQYNHYEISVSDLKWYASRVLNYSDEKISANPDMDWEGYGYKYKNTYYFADQGIGGPAYYLVKDMKVRTDGVYYYLNYTMRADCERDYYPDVKMQAVVSYKYDRGQYFWSLYTVKEVK